MGKQHRTPTVGPSPGAPAPGGLASSPIGSDPGFDQAAAYGNAAAALHLGGGAGDRADPDGGSEGAVPYRAQMEAAFGEDFGGVRASFGVRDALGDLGANAAASGEHVAFADAYPDAETVAHELTHVVQQRRGGTTGQADSGSVSSPGDASEKEARDVAANVAAGAPAGPIRSAPSAEVHRDASPSAGGDVAQGTGGQAPAGPPPTGGPPADPKGMLGRPERWYGKFEVYFDGTLPLDGKASAAGYVAIEDTAFQTLEGEKRDQVWEAQRAIRDALTKPCDCWMCALSAALRDVPPELQEHLFTDEDFLEELALRTSPAQILRLANALDPVRHLEGNLTVANTTGGDPAVLEAVATWARANPGNCDRALADGPLQATLHSLLGEADKITALQSLAHRGQAPGASLDALITAMHAGDGPAFGEAWSLVLVEAESLAKLRNDANFLANVEYYLGDLYEDMVRAMLLHEDGAKTPGAGPMTEEERSLVQAAANATAGQLRPELEATLWTSDANVLAALTLFDQTVHGLLALERGKADQDPKLAEARAVLVRTYEGFFGPSLRDKIADGVDDAAKQATCLTYAGLADGGGTAPTPATPAPALDETLLGLAREWAGKLAQELDNLIAVRDDTVDTLFTQAQAAIVAAVETDQHGVVALTDKKVVDERVRGGLLLLKAAYDAQYGSLSLHLHNYVQTTPIRHRCLGLIGEWDAGTDVVAAGAAEALPGDGAAQVEYDTLLDAFRLEMQRLAQELYDELQVDWVAHDDNALRYCQEYAQLRDGRFAPLLDSPAFQPGDYVRALESAYAPLGGSLRRALTAGLSKSNADEAFALLGLGDSIAASGEVDPADPTASRAATAAKPPLATAWRAIDAGASGDAVPSLEEAWDAAAGEMEIVSSDAAIQDVLLRTYRAEFGIEFTKHLARRISEEEWRQEAAAALRWTEPIPREHEVDADEARANADTLLGELSGGAALPPEFQFDPLKCGKGFTLEIATSRAIELHEAVMSADRATVVILLASHVEENRVVLAFYSRAFGHELKFDLRTAFGTDDFAELERMSREGGADTFSGQILSDVRAKDLERIYEQVYLASPEQRQELLAATDVLYDIRTAFGEEPYERIYKCLVDPSKVNLEDLLVTRDTGGDWELWGTDEKGVESDVKLIFERLKMALEGPLKGLPPDEAAARLDPVLKAEARRLFADPGLREIIEAEFSLEQLVQIKQLVLGAGERSGEDKAVVDMWGWGTGDALIAHLREMPDEERKRLRADPEFLAALSTDLSGSELQTALDVLFADKGKEHDAGIRDAVGTFATDEEKIFDTVLAMSEDELYALSQDAVHQAEIRAELDNTDDELQLFDAIMRDAALLGRGSKVEGQPLADSEQKRITEGLVTKHAWALVVGATNGKRALFEAAQQAYLERGETVVDPGPPAVKKELYGKAEGQAAWAKAAAEVTARMGWAEGDADRVAVQQAVEKDADISQRQLDASFAGWNSEESAVSALANASPKQVAGEWSNVVQPGTSGGRLQDVFDAYVDALQTEWDEQGALVSTAHDQTLAAEQAYVDFRLDLSARLVSQLAQVDWGLLGTGDAKLLEWKGKARAKVLALTADDIYAALDTSSYQALEASVPAGATPTDPGLAEVVARVHSVKAGLTSDDRRVRSEATHRGDTFDQQRSDFSIVEFGAADERIDLGYARLLGEVGAATEGDSARGEVGRIDEVELGKVKEMLSAFDVSVEEYKAAKSTLSTVLETAAVLIITAIATALTGPGGPTLGAALMTAFATSMTTAVIDEVVMGQDYEFWQQGMKDLVVNLGTTYVTMGLGPQVFEKLKTVMPRAALDNVAMLSDKYAQFERWEKGLAEAAEGSMAGFGEFVVYSGAKGALVKGTSDLQGAALGVVDPSLWASSMGDGTSGAQRIFEQKAGAIGPDMLEAFWVAAVQSGAGVIKNKVIPPPPKQSVMGGVPEAADTDPGDPTVTAAGKASLGQLTSGDEWKKIAFDQAVSIGIDKLKSGEIARASGWTGSEIQDFVVGVVRTQFETALTKGAEQYQSDSNAKQAWDTIAKLDAKVAAHIGTLPEDERKAAAEHFVHFVKTGVTDYDEAMSEWKEAWEDVQTQLADRARRSGGTLDPAYKAWVLADPAKIAERATVDPSSYVKALATAEKTRADIQSSAAYAELQKKPELAAFYDFYLSDASALVKPAATVPGGAGSGGDAQASALDIRTAAGLDGLKKAYSDTKRSLITSFSADVSKDWPAPKKEAFATYVKQTDPGDLTKMPVLDPSDDMGVVVAITDWTQRWGRAYDVAHPAPTVPR